MTTTGDDEGSPDGHDKSQLGLPGEDMGRSDLANQLRTMDHRNDNNQSADVLSGNLSVGYPYSI